MTFLNKNCEIIDLHAFRVKSNLRRSVQYGPQSPNHATHPTFATNLIIDLVSARPRIPFVIISETSGNILSSSYKTPIARKTKASHTYIRKIANKHCKRRVTSFHRQVKTCARVVRACGCRRRLYIVFLRLVENLSSRYEFEDRRIAAFYPVPRYYTISFLVSSGFMTRDILHPKRYALSSSSSSRRRRAKLAVSPLFFAFSRWQVGFVLFFFGVASSFETRRPFANKLECYGRANTPRGVIGSRTADNFRVAE